jgi:hypothetical protein
VFDVRAAEGRREPRVTHLIVGRSGVQERLLGGRRPEARVSREGEAIPWEAVIEIGATTITIRDRP